MNQISSAIKGSLQVLATPFHKQKYNTTKQSSSSQAKDANASMPNVRPGYTLSRPKAVAKKVKASEREFTLTCEYKTGNIVLTMQAGSYEILRHAIDHLYGNHPDRAITCTTKSTIDESDEHLETAKHYMVSGNGEKLFTINLYHTRCRILVNGKHELDFINFEFPLLMQIVDYLQQRYGMNAITVNNLIKQVLVGIKKQNEESDSDTEAKCIKCNKNVKTRAVYCTGKHWVHYNCDRLSDTDIKLLSAENYLLYRCKTCNGEISLPEIEYESVPMSEMKTPEIKTTPVIANENSHINTDCEPKQDIPSNKTKSEIPVNALSTKPSHENPNRDNNQKDNIQKQFVSDITDELINEISAELSDTFESTTSSNESVISGIQKLGNSPTKIIDTGPEHKEQPENNTELQNISESQTGNAKTDIPKVENIQSTVVITNEGESDKPGINVNEKLNTSRTKLNSNENSHKSQEQQTDQSKGQHKKEEKSSKSQNKIITISNEHSHMSYEQETDNSDKDHEPKTDDSDAGVDSIASTSKKAEVKIDETENPNTNLISEKLFVNAMQSLDSHMSKIAEYFETEKQNMLHNMEFKQVQDKTLECLQSIKTKLDESNKIHGEVLMCLQNLSSKAATENVTKTPDTTSSDSDPSIVQTDMLHCLKNIDSKLDSHKLVKIDSDDKYSSYSKQQVDNRFEALEKRLKVLEQKSDMNRKTKVSFVDENQKVITTEENIPKTLYSDKIKSSSKIIANDTNKPQTGKTSGESTKKPDMIKVRGKGNPLSNLYMPKNKIKIKGEWFNSSEQAYQDRKCTEHNAKGLQQRIRSSTDTMHIMKCGQKITTTMAWKSKKRGIMKEILEAKYVYDETFRNELIATGDSTIVEDTYHPFWGGRKGKNTHGQLLMEVRDNPPQLMPVETVPNDKPNNNNTLCIVDSNASCINYNRILYGQNVIVKKAHTIEKANEVLSTFSGPEPDQIILHTGTNDLIEYNDTANQFLKLTDSIMAKWPHAKLIVSKVLPRGGKNMYKKVKMFNNTVENALIFNDKIELVDHSDMYWGENPNIQFFTQEVKNGRNVPILHLNDEGLSVLANKIKYSFKRIKN